jgi:transcriptional regulator with XRE-family HTH domain
LTPTCRTGIAYRHPPRRICYSKGEFHFVDVHVGARLRQRRELLGIKIQNLAAAAGVSFQQVQKYESAENRISPGRLYQFARALGVPVDWFFDGLPCIGAGEDKLLVPEHELYSPETASLAEAYLQLPADRHRAVLQLIRSMIETPSG